MTPPNAKAPGSARGLDEPLRVLIVHNAYQQRGGEDAVVEAEYSLLQQHGHPVHLYQRHNDELRGRNPLALVRDTVWSSQTGRDFAPLLSTFRPDVVHVHNSFPLVSPSVYWAAHRAGVPVVQTLHNFRLICPQAMLLRNGMVCEDCVGRAPWPAVVHGCYRGSRAQSAAVAAMLQTHRALRTWRDKVTLYVALNEFCRDKFVQGGLPAERIRIKPNFVDLPAPAPQERGGFLFVGRLSAEKGVDVLAAAMQSAASGVHLRVAGAGPEQARISGAPNTTLLGSLDAPAVYAEMARSEALVIPSIWYENFPRTLVEAFANRLPVIASRLGALAALVREGDTGLLFEPGDASDLAARLHWAAAHPEEMARMGRRAREVYEFGLSAAANYRQLLAIYGEAVEGTR